MKADVSYNDFIGTVAADISDFLNSKYGDTLDSFGKYFKIDSNRFKVIGISIYGPQGFSVSILCVDKEKSTLEKEHVVSMSVDLENENEIFDLFFKRLHIVLYSRFDQKYPGLRYDEEVQYQDFH